jgi:tetratricopeptide (TPR) repeat protein
MAMSRAGRTPPKERNPTSRPGADTAPRPRVAPLAVGLLALAVFWPAVHNQFVNWDDDKNFLNNPYFRGFGGGNLRWIFTNFHLGHYHPLTWVSLALDYSFWGLDPTGYHLTNVLLHAANAVLFYFVARRLLGGAAGWGPVFAALVFAVHPLRVESVAWASERRDVLSGLFYLLAVLAYLRAQQEGPKRPWLAASVAAFGAALLSKVIVVSLPVVLLVLDAYPLRRWAEWKTALAEKIPYLALAGAAAVAALALQPTGVAGFAGHVAVLPGLRLGLSLYGLAFYLWKTVAPFGLYPQYVMGAQISPLDWRIVLSAAVVVAITVAAVALRRRWPAGLAVWICYVAGLLPVLSIVRVDPQQYVADHHTYLATLGLALLAGAGLAALPGRGRGAAVLVVAVLGVLSWRQTGVWRDSVTLWTVALEGSPDSAVAHNDLGEALAAENRLAEAIPQFEAAIRLRPNHAQAYYNLGRALRLAGRLESSIAPFEKAIEIEPAFAAAHNDLANGYAELGRAPQALEQYQLALRYEPEAADTHYNLGRWFQNQGQLEAAIEQYRQAVKLKPSLADAQNNWGLALDTLGRPAEAMERYRQALAVDPRNADAHNNLGVSLASAGRRAEAREEFQAALRANPQHRDAAANLARVSTP